MERETGNLETPNPEPGTFDTMTSSDLDDYNQKFFEIIGTFQEFKSSQEYTALGENDKTNPSLVLSTFASYLAGQLKNNLNEQELLKSIELLDKIYLACTMKDEINTRFFNLLVSGKNPPFSKVQGSISPELKKDLEEWSRKHEGKIFGSD